MPDGIEGMMSIARELRDEGMERVEYNAHEHWKLLMEALLAKVAQTHKWFTSDDVFDLYDALLNPPVTHDRRAFGPIVMRLVKKRLIKKANVASVPSRRGSLHASPRAVWESLIYEGPA